MIYDDGVERLNASLGTFSLIACLLSIPSSAQAATSHKVKVERGLIIIDDHVHQQDEDDDRVVSTAALADGFSRWTSVVAYYNPETNGVYLLDVDGSDVATASIATTDQPSDAVIEAAIEALVPSGSEYKWIHLGSLQVGRATTTYTLAKIDLTPRPQGVRTDRKTVSTSGSTPA